MKELRYKTGFKCASILAQLLCLALLVLCIQNMSYWMEGSSSIGEMGRSFEETSVFLNAVEMTARTKIASQQNIELFELNGQYDEMKEIDIRQYCSGIRDDASINLNTAYYIRDLLYFHGNGEAQMRSRIQKLISGGRAERETGEILDSESQSLETVLPISGSSLADYAHMSTNPSAALLEYYQNLCEASQDIALRYEEYRDYQKEPESQENNAAPSNVRYYVENTSTKERYTNLGVKSLAAAQRLVQNEEALEFLYLGERKFNIMVANTEYVMNEEAASWFINTRFLGNGEKVLLAVDMSYPIGDDLQEKYLAFSQREPLMVGSMILGGASFLVMLILFALSVSSAGKTSKKATVQLTRFDRIPTEIAIGLNLVAVMILYILAAEIRLGLRPDSYAESAIVTAAAVAEYGVFLFAALGFTRRLRTRSLWSNSVCFAVLLGCRQVYSAKQYSKRLLIAYLVFFALNFFFLRFFGYAGIVMALVLDMAVLLYLMRDVVGKQSVREGLYRISQGHLDYKIETTALTGESLEMARAVNEMGDGLQEAVDAIIKNERLKSELITNVSHDIKTPLTSIINYVDLLKREELQNERAEEYIRILEQKSQRLKQLTEDLIEASKINSGNVELHLMELNLRQLLLQAFGEFEDRLEAKTLIPELSMDQGDFMIRADGRQLWRIFENLLGNIEKYAMPETKVLLKLVKKDGQAGILFENTSRQRLQKSAQELQERFVRGDLSRTTEGSGLGLSIASSLTELMGGSFEAEAEEYLFRVTLRFPLIPVQQSSSNS